MNQRNTSVALLAAGATAGLTLTYLTRRTRARLRKPLTQAVTILAPRERVEAFISSREHMAQALESTKRFAAIERVEVRHAPGDRGTEVYLTMRGTGKYAIKEILRRAKSLLEAGEIPTGRRYAA
jgi:hypothetical protein